jgi:DNA (cytosine-5)-methyltransferase 1
MAPKTSYVSVTDQFCGAGGSSIGATAAGAELRLALNHWKLAIETHNSNFPDADHDCTDISACDPRRYPSTDILITSPECTNHSLAKGKVRKMQAQVDMFGPLKLDPAEERSRATMWDVVRFAEHHRYRIVIVENVVEARWWAPFDAWLHAMQLLGYNHKLVYLNSMFAHPTPQSRDRMYVVFWQKSLRAPNLDFRPRAHCPQCGKDVPSVQSWKNPKKPWGKYGQQYLYRCPECAAEVTPYYFAAFNAIDWSLPAPRIGDRARPLKEKTLKRIEIGLKKFARPIQLDLTQDEGRARPLTDPAFTQVGSEKFGMAVPPFLMDYVHTSRGEGGEMVWTTDKPHRTMLGIHTHALITPPLVVPLEHGDNQARPVTEPYPTQTTAQGSGVLVPPFLVQTSHPYHEREVKSYPADGVTPTQTGRAELGLAVPPFLMSVNHSTDRARSVEEPAPTAMPQGNPYLVAPPPYLIDLRGENAPRETTDPLSTVVGSGNHHGVVVPFLSSYHSTGNGAGLDEPVPTQDTRDRHALVLAPFILSYYTRLSGQQAAVAGVESALPTVPGRATHYLAQPGETPRVEDCGFRMLQPHEIGRAMAFPSSYKVVGNQRERVKQYGNAVTPPVMRWLVERCVEVLG